MNIPYAVKVLTAMRATRRKLITYALRNNRVCKYEKLMRQEMSAISCAINVLTKRHKRKRK